MNNTKKMTRIELADEAIDRAMYMVAQCRAFKEPRLAQIAKYRNLYAGNIKKKFRQPFNVNVPVFAGAIDTLQAAFNDDLAVRFQEQEKADYMSAKKITSLWEMEVASTTKNAKFPQKTRTDRANAIYSGRGFMMNYAQSIPEFRNNFEIYELEDAIFQPMGGVHLENHLYVGRENILRSAATLEEEGSYNTKQVKKLLEVAAKTDYFPVDDMEVQNSLAKFQASGLDPKTNDYIGEQMFNLVEMTLTIDGKRWYLLFSPWYRIWLRFELHKDMFSSDLYPWVSWATHEDNKNFLSKSYADDMYSVADAIHTLFNQELTNREKRNMNARAFDKDMFPDVAALDAAQYRPDALVSVDTKGGTRQISQGIYEFRTAELTGTVNLIDWMNAEMGKDVGVTDLSMGGSQQTTKKASVVFAEQQNISKRLLLRSSPYTEAMGEIGKLFIQGLKDHMPAKRAVRFIGEDAEGWDEITRLDLDTYSDIDIRIISSSIEMKNNQLKKEARMKTLSEITANPTEAAYINPRGIVEEKLRSGGEFDDAEIAVLMDMKNYGNKEESAYAHKAIQDIVTSGKTDLYYGATTLFFEIIYDYARNNRTKIGDKKYIKLLDYVDAHNDIVMENMQRKAKDEAQTQPLAPVAGGGGGNPAVAPAGVPDGAVTGALKGAVTRATRMGAAMA